MASNLAKLVASLPKDTAQAVEMLARFEFARPVQQRAKNPAERYWDAENDITEPDTLNELRELCYSRSLPVQVYGAFLERIKTPGVLKLRQVATA